MAEFNFSLSTRQREFAEKMHIRANAILAELQEPKDKEIIANLGNMYNIYHRLILLMKLDTQTYYKNDFKI